MSEQNPHDSLARYAFGQRDVAIAELSNLLPAPVLAHLDLGALHLEQGTFIDEELKDRHTDLLFSARAADGEAALVYVLLEHQSSVDRNMPQRVYRYISRVWDQWRLNHPNDDGRLPAIIPIVLYHGARRWTAPTSLSEMYMLEAGAKSELGAHLPQVEFILEDLTLRTEEEMLASTEGAPPLLPLTLLHLKTLAYTRDAMAEVLRWAPLFALLLRTPEGDRHLRILMRYTLTVSRDLEPMALFGSLKTAVDEAAQEELMSHPNRYVQEIEERGADRAQVETIIKMLRLKFGDEAESARSQLEAASSEKRDQVLERILTADSIETVLEGL